ncbi:hypothetical protein SEA_JULIETTE_37 [Mycobacterium phage Juliette]|nr:hypothetical protein SEA_JULIETTE_37 [Mycobacterium phage Juliette]USH45315.1 hypothetical protein SEA_RUTHIEJR_36 [Mycobacterium phage Ruthiejr]
MSLADDVAAGNVAPAGIGPSSRCCVCRWYERLDQRDRDAFDQWLDDVAAGVEGRTVSGLWWLCRANGLRASKRWFAEHVNVCHVAG